MQTDEFRESGKLLALVRSKFPHEHQPAATHREQGFEEYPGSARGESSRARNSTGRGRARCRFAQRSQVAGRFDGHEETLGGCVGQRAGRELARGFGKLGDGLNAHDDARRQFRSDRAMLTERERCRLTLGEVIGIDPVVPWRRTFRR